MFWPLVSHWYLGGYFVCVAFLFSGEWLISPNSKGSAFLLSAQIHTSFLNTCTVCPRYLSAWCRFVFGGLWNAEVCCQPSSFIEKVLAIVIPFCVWHTPYRVHWRLDGRVELFRSSSAPLLTGSTIRGSSSSSVLWDLEVLCCLFWHSFSLIGHSMSSCRSKLVNVVSGVLHGSVLGPQLFLLYTAELFSIVDNKLYGYADDSTLLAVVPSPSERVSVTESLNSELNRVSICGVTCEE